MWKQFFSVMKQLITLTEDTKRNTNDIHELQAQMRDLTIAFEQLRYEIRRVSEKDDHEREKIMLRLENELLRYERHLQAKRDDES